MHVVLDYDSTVEQFILRPCMEVLDTKTRGLLSQEEEEESWGIIDSRADNKDDLSVVVPTIGGSGGHHSMVCSTARSTCRFYL
mmetsp:Transcript_18646/g.34751  ORF Transcript_18646/g.34751 Transcript_18646/m.34751 type:complete len:83 (-) Transcript_18646:48-296(-)